MKKLLNSLFTGAVLICLVSSAYVSYYLRPWRWLARKGARPLIPDNPFADLPLPDSGKSSAAEPAEKVVA